MKKLNIKPPTVPHSLRNLFSGLAAMIILVLIAYIYSVWLRESIPGVLALFIVVALVSIVLWGTRFRYTWHFDVPDFCGYVMLYNNGFGGSKIEVLSDNTHNYTKWFWGRKTANLENIRSRNNKSIRLKIVFERHAKLSGIGCGIDVMES